MLTRHIVVNNYPLYDGILKAKVRTGGFLPEALAGAISGMRGERRYTSLVPTQLIKAIEEP
ncbi:hypothetical protein K4G96_27265, partial [Mycobacterium tuberculosis]|nr:hypothetical protein [Mycobacterium tuberculosis]